MIRLTPTNNPEAVLKYIKGDGLLRKCCGGMKEIPTRDQLAEMVRKSRATFLVAQEDNRGLGFVVFNPESNGNYSLHLCLRTIGAKTRKIIALAVQYAKFVLATNEIDAVFPESHKACQRLSKELGFRDDKNLKLFYKTPEGVPYAFKKLII